MDSAKKVERFTHHWSPVIFTDGISKGKARYVANQYKIIETHGLSTQQAEVTVVIHALRDYPEPINILSN